MSPEEVIRRVVEAAHRRGEMDTRAIVKAVMAQGPVGRLILKMLDLPVKRTKSVGRPLDLVREEKIRSAVDKLLAMGRTPAEAHREASKILMRQGVYGPGPVKKPLGAKRVRDAYRALAHRWFEPPMD